MTQRWTDYSSSSDEPSRDLARREDPAITSEVWDKRRTRRKGKMPLWQEIPLLLLIALGLAVLVRTFFFQAFFIPSGSMEDTLQRQDRVVVNKLASDFERGDIIVFRGPENWVPENAPDPNSSFFTKLGRGFGDLIGFSEPGEKDFIKRVIGLPGDRVSCCDVKGRIFVNGVPIDEAYVTKDADRDAAKTPGKCGPRAFDEVTVEPGMLFVMGDHRLVSQDSRCQGQVPIESVIGRAFAIVWPAGRMAGLDAGDTFAKVPASDTQSRAGMADGRGTSGSAAAILGPIIVPYLTARRARERSGWSRRLRA